MIAFLINYIVICFVGRSVCRRLFAGSAHVFFSHVRVVQRVDDPSRFVVHAPANASPRSTEVVNVADTRAADGSQA